VHLLKYVVKCTVRDSPFNNQASCSICLDIFSDLCDQRTCKLTKHCSVVDASCNAENSLEELFSRVHLRTCVGGWNFAVGVIITPK
jgi:hypothetical protein